MSMLKRSVALLLLLVVAVLFSANVFVASAEEHSNVTVNRFNVMLVVDKSGSLRNNYTGHGTDPEGLRFDAMKLFLGLLTETGNNVGAVVFDETVKLDTGLLPMRDMTSKLSLVQQIEDCGTGYETNIGTAVLNAVHNLEGMKEKNGLPGVVLLLTDGKTEGLSAANARQAETDAKRAVEQASEAGIVIHGILLNNGNVDREGEREIRNYTDGTGGQYEIVTQASDLTYAFRRFYSIINNTDYTGVQKTPLDENGTAEIEFIVPRFGLEEANIVIEHDGVSNQTLDKLIDVRITKPDGSSYSVSNHQILTSRYILIKIPQPMTGKWTVKLKGSPDDSADISMIYNSSMTASLRCESNLDALILNQPYTFTIDVVDESNPNLSESELGTMNAVLHVKNAFTDAQTDYPMNVVSGGYSCDVRFLKQEGLSIYATVGVGGFEVRTETLQANAVIPTPELRLDGTPEDLIINRPYRFNVTPKGDGLSQKELSGLEAVIHTRNASGETASYPMTVSGDGYSCEIRFARQEDLEIWSTLGFGSSQNKSDSINTNVIVPEPVLSCDGDYNEVIVNRPYRFTVDFAKVKLSASELEQFSTVLHVRDASGKTNDYPMDASGEAYSCEIRFENEDKYAIDASISFGDSQRRTAVVNAHAVIPDPYATVKSVEETIPVGLFQPESWEMNINGLAEDPKGMTLEYALSDDCDGKVSLSGEKLIVRGKGAKELCFSLIAMDPFSHSCEIPFILTVRNMTVVYLLALLLALLVIALLIVLVRFLQSRRICAMQITIDAFEGTSRSPLMPLYNFRGKRSLQKLGQIYGARAKDYWFEATSDREACFFKGKKKFYVNGSEEEVKSVRILSGMTTTVTFDKEGYNGLEISTFSM